MNYNILKNDYKTEYYSEYFDLCKKITKLMTNFYFISIFDFILTCKTQKKTSKGNALINVSLRLMM